MVSKQRPAVIRPIEDIFETGVLWAINTMVFHPRGYSLTVHRGDDEKITGWSVSGDGVNPISIFYDEVTQQRFESFHELLSGEYGWPFVDNSEHDDEVG